MYTAHKNPFKRSILKEQSQEYRHQPPSKVVMQLNTDDIIPNPSQPRFIFEDEPLLRLADSIRRLGILQPLSVRRINSLSEDCTSVKYEIIAGERRWRAAKILGLQTVPCIILDVDQARSAELALVENIQREDLNFFEQASAIASLIDSFGITQEQAARKLSTSQSYIANKIRLLKLTADERTAIIKHSLTERHARALLRLTDVDKRSLALSQIIRKELNVSAAEKYIDSLLLQQHTPTHRQTVRSCIKDLRFFYNSINRAVDLLKGCGVDVVTEKKDSPEGSTITITIPSK